MSVPMPRMCSVLAHELRSPLSVLQGYVRMLQRQRDANHPEAAMLDAMLDATGRLATIARQASDLGNWLSANERQPRDVVALDTVFDALTDRLGSDEAVAIVRPLVTGAPPRQLRGDPAALADALVAVVTAMRRDDQAAVIEVLETVPAPGQPAGITVRPQPTKVAPAESGRAPHQFAFDRGGAGLALVAASYVFDGHGASVEATAIPGGLNVHFPHPGSAQ